MITVLNFNNKFPTMIMKENAIKRAWGLEKIGKMEDFTVSIKDLEVISEHGRINYEFDEFKH